MFRSQAHHTQALLAALAAAAVASWGPLGYLGVEAAAGKGDTEVERAGVAVEQ